MSQGLQLLPGTLQDAVAAALGTRLLDSRLLSGGMVNQAAQVVTGEGAVFVKWHNTAPPRLFAAEAQGLQAIQATGTLRTPAVLAFHDKVSSPPELAMTATDAPPAFLVLEYLEPRPPSDAEVLTQQFATALAAMHRETFSPCGFGLPYDNYLGTLPQTNTPCASWTEFYRDQRLLPQLAIAHERGLMPPHREHWLRRVLDKLDALLDDCPTRPALLHGDLWSGNFLPLGNTAAVIDPAIYYGEREVEMAFIELFDGFPSGFMAAYRAKYPLDSGYARRRPLHQLYPLLVHLNHFGETYGAKVERVCQFYVASP